MSLLTFLADKKVIKHDDIAAIEISARKANDTVDAILLKRGVPTEDLLKWKSEYMGIPTRIMDNQTVPFDILQNIPEESAAHYKIVPLGVRDGALEVGIVDPDNIEAKDALTFISTRINMPYKLFLISSDDFDKILQSYKGLSGEVTKALSELETELSVDTSNVSVMQGEKGSDAPEEGAPKKKFETKIIEDAPVTKIVATVLRYATEGKASDIHIEPMRDRVRVRFRVDGILHTSIVLPVKVLSAVVARIKILSNMKLDEKRKPQDGRFSARIEGRKIDFRVSTFPSAFGEKVVMRILDPERGVKKLENMGFSKRCLEMVRRALDKPYGLILISGPTGSGKSTTLYSMLNELDRETQNIMSLEDPIEYNIEGLNQSQMRPDIGYTFASGLRTALRQDPDIIMVGEIRDKETAQLAVQAALTGHLVLSTIHTNNAAGVIPRLIDMGVDPYLIAPTLILAIAQRLVTTLCEGTGEALPVEGSIKAMVEKEFADLAPEIRKELEIGKNVYRIRPTPECPNGVRGRTAVFELMEMDKDIERVILKSPTELEVSKIAREKGMITLHEDALLKSMKGIVPFEEVNALI